MTEDELARPALEAGAGPQRRGSPDAAGSVSRPDPDGEEQLDEGSVGQPVRDARLRVLREVLHLARFAPQGGAA